MKNLSLDYLVFITFKLLGLFLRLLPWRVSLFLGEAIGVLLYYFDLKHRALVYANMKKALKGRYPCHKIKFFTKKFYRNFGQNIIEVFLIPRINKKYIDKYIIVEGKDNIEAAFAEKKGVILLGVHSGSWELTNVVCANLGFSFNLFVREQKFARLEELLNFYRQQKGCKLIRRHEQMRQLIRALKENEAIGMTADQGGKSGELVEFFGKEASMPTGAIKLALKYGAVILPAYYSRLKGPYHKIIFKKPFLLSKSPDKEACLKDNLQKLMPIYEDLISLYPSDYYWPYKIWKYGRKRNILILSDSKTGHLRQSEAVALMAKETYEEKGYSVSIKTVKVTYRSKRLKALFTYLAILTGRYSCQGCLKCLQGALNPDCLQNLINSDCDLVVSCGSSLAAVNFLLSKENNAGSIVIMKPSILSTKRFDLVILPRHDKPRISKNIVVTQAALNPLNEKILIKDSAFLSEIIKFEKGLKVGLLIGGDSKRYRLDSSLVKKIIEEIKLFLEKYDGELLATTSRRTPREIELDLKKELKDYSRCKFLVIASQKNLPFYLTGILGLSDIIISSAESISMVSESLKSSKYVAVFGIEGLRKKHKAFINLLSQDKYIYVLREGSVFKELELIWEKKPQVKILDDNRTVKEKLKEIL